MGRLLKPGRAEKTPLARSLKLCYLSIRVSAGGRSSVVERQLPKLYVVGSIPIARSSLSD